MARRSREHGAHAGKLGGSPGSEIGGEPPLEDRIGQGFDAAALDLGDSLVPNLICSDFRGGVAENERRDAIGMVTIELLSDEAADGQPDNRRASNAGAIQERREVARIVGHVVLIGSGFRKPVAALVISDDTEVAREDLGDLIPDAEVGPEGIDEDERRPVAAALVAIMDDEAVGL